MPNTIPALLAAASQAITADDLDRAADLAARAGALSYASSKLVCDIEICGESPAVAEFLLSYAVDGWRAAAEGN